MITGGSIIMPMDIRIEATAMSMMRKGTKSRKPISKARLSSDSMKAGASEVSGVVQNLRERPVADTVVLVCSSVPVFWMQTSRRARVTFTDQDGRWSVAGLPPGEYFAIASPTISEGDLGRRGRLAALQTISTPFRIESDDARPTLTLQLSSAVQIPSVR